MSKINLLLYPTARSFSNVSASLNDTHMAAEDLNGGEAPAFERPGIKVDPIGSKLGITVRGMPVHHDQGVFELASVAEEWPPDPQRIPTLGQMCGRIPILVEH